MENYVGKICPFCKTEITENDTVKVCPSCETPHHEACWNENRGCTTFGCAEKYNEEQTTDTVQEQPADVQPDVIVCANCSTPFADGQQFCANCGSPRPVPAPAKNFCGKCGNELTPGQEFCPMCGHRAGLTMDADVTSAINQFNAGVEKTNEARKKKPMKIVIAIVAAVLAIILCVTVAPKIFVSVEGLCAKGDYEKAYEKAKGDEKDEVIAENNIAVCSAITVDSLKDSKSFDLREAWYNDDKGHVILKVAANNSYGNTVINYWLFTYDHEKDNEWELWDAYSDLEKEQSSKYDDTDELLEKLINNLGKEYILQGMTSEYKLDNSGVERINDLFEEGTLDSVDQLYEAIPEETESED